MASFGLAIITRSETRLAMCAVLWFVLHQKVGGLPVGAYHILPAASSTLHCHAYCQLGARTMLWNEMQCCCTHQESPNHWLPAWPCMKRMSSFALSGDRSSNVCCICR
jgi:hypothetical protein